MRMSDAEAIMWAVEKDPALRSDFLNITILDGHPDEDRLRAKLDAALDDIPRLRERVVSPPLRLAPPAWQEDPTLDLDYHVRKLAVPAPGGMRQLLDLAATCAATPLDRSRPLWEFTLVEGLEDGRTALLQKVHHAVTDGVGGLRLSLSLVDFEPDPPLPPPPRHRAHRPPRTTPAEVVTDAIAYTMRRQLERARAGVGRAAHFVADPDAARRALSDGASLAGSIRRQVLVTEPARSELLRPRSLGRRFEVCQVPLDPVKERAAALGGTVNDLFVTAVTGALGGYHDRMGAPCEELRMAMAVSLRADSDVDANSFAPSRVLVPVQPKDPAARFQRVRERLAAVRNEPALGAAGSLAGVLAPLPTSILVGLMRSQARTIDFATSNLRGSPTDLYLGGARIAASFPMGPRTGCALNITVLSYKGSLDLGLNLDPAAVTDPDAFVSCLEESFAALLT